MKRLLVLLVSVLAIGSAYLFGPPGTETPGTAWADQTTVTLSVPGMTCAACPITVGMSLREVDGVLRAEVSYEDLQAVVTYDSDKCGVAQLVEATTNVGYPSTVVDQ